MKEVKEVKELFFKSLKTLVITGRAATFGFLGAAFSN